MFLLGDFPKLCAFLGEKGAKKNANVFHPLICKKTWCLTSNSDEMPKFKKACQNPFHETWSKKDEGKIVNLQARGFFTVASALQQCIEAELGKKCRHKINHLCSICLKICSTNRKITKFFAKNELEDVKKSLQHNQVWKF